MLPKPLKGAKEPAGVIQGTAETGVKVASVAGKNDAQPRRSLPVSTKTETRVIISRVVAESSSIFIRDP